MSQSCNFMLGTPTPQKNVALEKKWINPETTWPQKYILKSINRISGWEGLIFSSKYDNFSREVIQSIFLTFTGQNHRFQGSMKGIFFFPLASEVQTCQYTYHNVTPFPYLALDTFDVCVWPCVQLYIDKSKESYLRNFWHLEDASLWAAFCSDSCLSDGLLFTTMLVTKHQTQLNIVWRVSPLSSNRWGSSNQRLQRTQHSV